MRKLIARAVLLLSIVCVCIPVSAAVVSTKEPTARQTVYVAGNPDLYPLEYYDAAAEKYDGILPRFYEQISAGTGIDFSYVSAGTENRQKALAEDFQVELVSAYHQGEVTPEKEILLFTYDKEGSAQKICIGFTKIADPELVREVEEALTTANKDMWLSAAMSMEGKTRPEYLVPGLMIAVGVLALVLIVVFVCMIIKHRKQKKQDRTKMVDGLTGIGNLQYFEDCYVHHISQEMRPLYYVGYIAIDIDKTQTYFGKQEAEELQRYGADILTNKMGTNDFVARINDGVFAVCFMCPDPDRALTTAAEFVNSLNAYDKKREKSWMQESDLRFRCGVYPLDRQNIPVETVLFNARQGYLYAANTKQDICLCSRDILDKVTVRSRLQSKIAEAMEKQEFRVYLQFMYDTGDNCLGGAEVLSRWHSPEGMLSPGDYIEDMKAAGMVDSLDLYMFEKTCQLLRDWKGTDLENVQLSCNFTRTTLSEPDFVSRFEAAISKYDFDRGNLLVEMTEEALKSENALAYKNVQTIKKQGCKIALDDFGSGYTSFSDLCDYPVDVIKIDKYITEKAAGNRGMAVLISIVRMAHALGIKVICKGVDTPEQSKRAQDAGCDYLQGHLYAHALPLENALDFYRNKQ